jgi:hypothetical protein
VRCSGFLLIIAAVLVASVTFAATPDPNRSGFELSGQGTACHYRFRADGGLDRLTVLVTVRDAFDVPVPDCSTSITLHPIAQTLSFCSCCPSTQGVRTDNEGVMSLVFDKLGGRGSLDVNVTCHCIGHIGLGQFPIDFTSPDLAASCAPVNVVSMGIWAQCLPPGPYCPASDYDCDGTVGVLDLAIWAGGLGAGCGGCP